MTQPDGATSASAVQEVLVTFGVVGLLTVLASKLASSPPLDAYLHLAVGALFLWTALHMAQRRADGIERYGLSLGGLLDPPDEAPRGILASLADLVRALLRAAPSALRETAVALALALVVFPLFTAGFWLWHRPARSFELELPPELFSYALTQLLVVALPEEALFRGFFQSRLDEGFAHRAKLLGATVCAPALLAQAVLFGILHFAVDANPARLAVAGPALLFGWLRELRGGIGAALVFHAACNLLSDVLVRSWL